MAKNYSINTCPGATHHHHCSDFIKKYLKFCLCNTRDGVSLFLGLASVLSWGVAEIPQIITNHTIKSTEGISISFIATWILGDLFNLFGCLLEPATLPTQYYTALLYTITSLILFAQTIYFSHLYHPSPKTEPLDDQQSNPDDDCENAYFSSPPVQIQNHGKSCYKSGRYLPRTEEEEPLLSGIDAVSCMAKSAPGFSSLGLACSFLMGVSGGGGGNEYGYGYERIAGFLGWGMAVIYMFGRVPQIWLNVRRGSVKGLNPCMFVFALVGNVTYVGSIVVKSMEWRDLRPNMPWLVDAVGCVVLDSLILVQYFYYATVKGRDEK